MEGQREVERKSISRSKVRVSSRYFVLGELRDNSSQLFLSKKEAEGKLSPHPHP